MGKCIDNHEAREGRSDMGGDGRWISCPACGNERYLWVPVGARASRIPVYCKRCRRYPELNIED